MAHSTLGSQTRLNIDQYEELDSNRIGQHNNIPGDASFNAEHTEASTSSTILPSITVPAAPKWNHFPERRNESFYPDLPKIPLDRILSRYAPSSGREEKAKESSYDLDISVNRAERPMGVPVVDSAEEPVFHTVNGVLYRNGVRYGGWAHEPDVMEADKTKVAHIMAARWNCIDLYEARRRMSAHITREYAQAILDSNTDEVVLSDIVEKTIAKRRKSKGNVEINVETLLRQRGITAKSTLYKFRKSATELVNDFSFTPEEAVEEVLIDFGSKPKKKSTFGM